MVFGSFVYKLTAEDRRIMSWWKWRVAAVYGAILLMLVLVAFAHPGRKLDPLAKKTPQRGFSSALVAGENRAR